MSNPSLTSSPPPDNSNSGIRGFLKNPYKTIKKFSINKSVLPDPIDFVSNSSTIGSEQVVGLPPCTEADTPWGDNLDKKNQSSTRLFFQNINGLSTKNHSKWTTSLEYLHHHQVDIAGIAEPCINVQNKRAVSSYLNKLSKFGPRSTASFSENTNPCERAYQPGGSLILCQETWKSRIVRNIQDERQWGRYVGYSFRINESTYLTIITAYRCINRLGTSLGHRTSVKHQKEGIINNGLHSSVRQLCLSDLADTIQNCNHSIPGINMTIVMIDANETLEEVNSKLPQFLRDTNLVDIIPAFHDFQGSTASNIRSQSHRRIDFMFGSPSILQYIDKCGYLPFHSALESDHRALFLDLKLQKIKDMSEFISSARTIGSHESKDVIIKYQNRVYQQFKNHNIFDKALTLSQSISFDSNFVTCMNSMDKQITEIVLQAEHKCATKRNNVRWNSEISDLSLMIKFFKLKRKFGESREFDNLIQTILDQMNENFLETVFTHNVRNMDPKSGIKMAIKKKKLAIIASKTKREDHYLEVAKRSQNNCSRLNLQNQLYLNQCHRNIQSTLGRNQFSALTTIDIPNPNTDANEPQWITISDPAQIQGHLIQRNISHFGQALSTEFASGPLAKELGYQGCNSSCLNLLQGKLPSSYADCSETTQLILEKLMQPPSIPKITTDLTFEEFCNGFQKWDEKTTTSPSGRHLGHYRVLLLDLQEDAKSTDTLNRDNSKAKLIMKVYYHMLLAVLHSGIPLDRWTTSHTSMIQKINGNSRIDKLRVIHIYEADYNLFLKIFWGRKMVFNSERNNQLNEGQYGSRPGKKSSDQVIKKIMVYDYSALTRSPIATMDNDAKSCFDRIVCTLAMLISLFYGMSLKLIQIHSTVLLHMKYKIKTALGPSERSYSHSEDTPIFGTGQGSCASPSLWLHISCFLMDILDSHSFGFTATSVTKDTVVKVNNQGFVDDTSIMTNGGQTTDELLGRLQSDAQTWSNLLYSSGGLLELPKCLYYIADYSFDSTGNPSPFTPQHDTLRLCTNSSSESTPIKLLNPSDSHKTLGCFRSLTGSEDDQYKILLEKSNDWAAKLRSRYLSRQEAWMVYHNYYLPQVMYSMNTTNFSQVQCDAIQSPVVQAILPLLGFNRHTSRSLVFGPSEYGGIGLTNLYTELYSTRIETIITHTRMETSELGKLFRINLELIQLLSGTSIPYLQSSSPINYIQKNWFSGLHLFLIKHELQIDIKSLWIPYPQRQNDKVIMDLIHPEENSRIQVINNWRVYFQVNLLSDIVTADGTKICKEYLTHPTQDSIPCHPERKTNLQWPRQGKPSQRSFPYWKFHILNLANSDQQGKLRKHLGHWNPVISNDNSWQYYYHPTGGLFFQDTQKFRVYEPTSRHRSSTDYQRTSTLLDILPNGSIPISIRSNSHTIRIPNPTCQTPVASVSPPPRDFNSYLDSLDTWAQRLLSMWWSVDLPELVPFLQHEQTIIIVSDGGCKPPKGSYGGVIGCTSKTQKATIEGFVKGGYTPLTSFRCEAYGMLSSLLFFKHLCRFFRIRGLQRQITYFCDGQSLLNRISNNRYKTLSNKDVLKEDFDLELQILHEIKDIENIGFKLSIHFVRGHQKISDESTPSAVFNQAADTLASRNLHAHNTWLPFDLLPTMKVIITYNKVLITGSIKKVIRNMVLFPGLYNDTQKQMPSAASLVKNIWWDIPRKTLLRFSRSDRFRIIKFNYGLLYTKSMEHKLDPNVSPTCPHCQTQPESVNHVLQCNHYQSQRQNFLDNLLKQMKSTLKNNAINECIYVGICSYINNTPCPDITSFIDDPSDYLTDAYLQQKKNGMVQPLQR
jgi:hypothetical protein